jgi:hypothetical protein
MHFACSTEFIPLIAAPLKKGERRSIPETAFAAAAIRAGT